MQRRATSWRVLAALLAVAVVMVGVLGRDLQRKDRTQTLQGLVRDAQLISQLAVEVGLSDEVGPAAEGHTLTSGARDRIRVKVVHLKAAGQLVGLQVWDRDNHLLYSDSADPEPLLGEELALLEQVRAGRPAVTFEHEAGRAEPTATVLLQPEYRAGVPTDLVVEVLLPRDATVAALEASAQRLYVTLGLLVAAVVGLLVSLRRRMLRREREATHDTLTGLGNRARLHQVGASALQASRDADRGHVALLLLDLDGFKTVNDTLGHALGDELLRQVGSGLQQCVRPTDLVTRLGGDEFGILLVDLPSPDVAARIATDLTSALQRPFLVEDVALEVSGSVGVAHATSAADDVPLLLRRADVAMYQAKRDGGGVRVYDPADDPHDPAQLVLLASLRAAIDAGQLRLHYQPRVHLRSGRAVGVEALVRWQHPVRGLLYPDAFLPLVEQTALMRPLTTWVLEEATRQVAAWRRSGWDVSVAVNIPPRALLHDDLCTQVVQVLARHDLPGEALELEITETAIMVDPDRAARTLRELRAVGVGVAIDDFGAGYTSLSYLRTLPVRSLKIDRGFITSLTSSPQDEAVARSVVTLGHDLGLTVVAEGVETEDVQQRLRELGCDEVQGYLLARPMEGARLEPWLLESAQRLSARAAAPMTDRRPAPG